MGSQSQNEKLIINDNIQNLIVAHPDPLIYLRYIHGIITLNIKIYFHFGVYFSTFMGITLTKPVQN